MKNILKYLSILILLVGLVSCEQQFTIETPEIISFKYDSSMANPNRNTTFEIEVIGDFAVIWGGGAAHDYHANLANPSNEVEGRRVNLLYDKLTMSYKGSATVTYDTTGSFTAVLIVSNIGYQGEIIEQAIQEMSVDITLRSGADITGFTFDFDGYDATTITNDSVLIDVRYGTDITALIPEISVSELATVNPASEVANDFTNPVVYTVTAQDGTTKDWIVKVSELEPDAETDITEFTIPEGYGLPVINKENHTVALNVRFGTDVTTLVPEITLSDWATVSPTTGVAADFTNPVVYTITAEDGTTSQDWTVTITTLPAATGTDITGFVIPEADGAAIINKTYHTVAIAIPKGADITALVPEITLSDFATIDPASEEETDFTNEVTYTVTAEDGTTEQDWTVTLTVLE